MTLQVRQIRKEFITRSGSLPVLCGIDLDLDSDKSLAIMGQSGSGKSTFLHVLGGLDKPSAGKILLDGLDPLAMNETNLAHYRNQKVGFVFQDHHLLPQCTVLENVLLPSLLGSSPKNEVIQLAKDLLARVGLENRMDHMPSELSGEKGKGLPWPALLSCAQGFCLLMSPPATLINEMLKILCACFLNCMRKRKIFSSWLPIARNLQNYFHE